MIASDTVLEKAARLLAENRVVLSRRNVNCAVVCGDTEHYEVWATPEGVTCECWHSTQPTHYCSHAVAAMVAWYERTQTTPFGPPSLIAEQPAPGSFAALLGGAV